MKKISLILLSMLFSCMFLVSCGNPELIQLEEPQQGQKIATISVEGMGDIKIMLFPEQAPKTVENFVSLAQEGYYDGVVFHRVIDDFMIQSGDPTGTGSGGHSIWNRAFEDEFDEKLYCFRGALCMANSGADTNGSQFFIVQNPEVEESDFDESVDYHKEQGRGLTSYPSNVKEAYLEQGGTPNLDGMHTVFGQVIEGMDIVDEISSVETNDNDKPLTNIRIETVTISDWEG